VLGEVVIHEVVDLLARHGNKKLKRRHVEVEAGQVAIKYILLDNLDGAPQDDVRLGAARAPSRHNRRAPWYEVYKV
jgi:hypothetical protein